MLKIYRYKISCKYVFDFWRLFQYRFIGLKLTSKFVKLKLFIPFFKFFIIFLKKFFKNLKKFDKKYKLRKNYNYNYNFFLKKLTYRNNFLKKEILLNKKEIELKKKKKLFVLNFYSKFKKFNRLLLKKKLIILNLLKLIQKLEKNYKFRDKLFYINKFLLVLKFKFLNFKKILLYFNNLKINKIISQNRIKKNIKLYSYHHLLTEPVIEFERSERKFLRRKFKRINKKRFYKNYIRRNSKGFNKILLLIKNFLFFGGNFRFHTSLLKIPACYIFFKESFLKFLEKKDLFFDEYFKNKKYFLFLNVLDIKNFLNINPNLKYRNIYSFNYSFINFYYLSSLISRKYSFLFLKKKNTFEVKPLFYFGWLSIFLKFLNLGDIFRFVFNSLFEYNVVYNRKFSNTFIGTKKDIVRTLRILYLKRSFLNRKKKKWRRRSWLLYRLRGDGHFIIRKYGIRRRRPKNKYFGYGLVEKQKIRFFYGMKEKNVIRMVFVAIQRFYNLIGNSFIGSLETRISMVLCRLNFLQTPRQSHQYVLHGFVLINGIIKYNPHMVLYPLDIISLKFNIFFKKKGFLNKFLFKKIPVSYLELDYSLCFSIFKKLPSGNLVYYPFKFRPFLLLNFYSHF